MKLSRWELKTRRTEYGKRRRGWARGKRQKKRRRRRREKKPNLGGLISPYQDKVRLWEAQG